MHQLVTINWNVWAPVGIGILVLIAVVFIGLSQSQTNAPQASMTKDITSTPAATPSQALPVATPPATGDVDGTVNAILAAAADDQALFADMEQDIAMIDTDSEVLNDVGQSYDEHIF